MIGFVFDAHLHHLSLPIIEDHYFKDKKVEVTRAILKEQEEKPDNVDYEVTVYKGTFTFFTFEMRARLMVCRDGSWFRCATELEGA